MFQSLSGFIGFSAMDVTRRAFVLTMGFQSLSGFIGFSACIEANGVGVRF